MPNLREFGSDGNGSVLNTPQSSRIVHSPPDVVQFYNQDTPFVMGLRGTIG